MAEKPITVTKAQPYDAVRVARMLEEWFEVSAIQWPPAQPGPMLEWVNSIIQHGYAVIAQKDGRLFGTAAIQPCTMPWNHTQPLCRDAWFYVPPGFRKLGVADALVTALKLHAAKLEMPLILEIISGMNTDKLERWYQIKGGKYAGGVLVYGLPDREG